MEAVLDVVLGVLNFVANGEPTDNALCRSLARRFDAAAAALIVLDPEASTATVTAWPKSVDLLRLKVVLDGGASPVSVTPGPARYWDGLASGFVHGVLGCTDLAQVRLDPQGRFERIVVLASGRAFDGRDLHVLDRLAALLSTNSQRASPKLLTARETEILTLVADGLMARTIAVRLDVSPRTVHKHLGSIYRKLEAHDRLMAVRRAERLGLLSSGPRQGSSENQTSVLTLHW